MFWLGYQFLVGYLLLLGDQFFPWIPIRCYGHDEDENKNVDEEICSWDTNSLLGSWYRSRRAKEEEEDKENLITFPILLSADLRH